MSILVQEILKGNPRAIAKGISLVENDGREAQELMKKVFPHTGRSVLIGITGASGSGKSTLVDRLIDKLREEEKKIGIVAVDPSSPFHGGAILGDRIRMMRHSADPEIFIRSMATRGQLGGLAKASSDAIAILEAAGKDVILVETVGVGQDEVDVVKLTDIVLVVLIPGAGDDIQAFKAGIMEIADIFVLNKADSPEIGKTERHLRAVLDLSSNEKSLTPVVKTISTEGKGIENLLKEIEKLIGAQSQKLQVCKKKEHIAYTLREIIQEKIYHSIKKNVQDTEFKKFVEKIYNREADPYTIADEIVRRLKGD
ncbi:methylmalonyl Co-A mutase-associated GTPase MeaB [Acidobacteriota bacterium]